MNVNNLRERYHELISFMESSGYSKSYIDNVDREIRHILRYAKIKGWSSYSDVYQEYTKKTKSSHSLSGKRTFLGLIEHFDVYGLYPDRRRYHKIVKRDKYSYLVDEFKAVIDYYIATETKRGKREVTVYDKSSSMATFLYLLQEKGFDSLRAVTEEAVLSVYVRGDEKSRRNYSHKRKVVAALKACIPKDPETMERILAFFPVLREKRKNIQYLLPEEIAAIKQTLADECSPLSLRDKAIGMLVLYTGLRSCDIAGLTMESIDWANDLIIINQQKTGVPLDLPLTAVVGNAVYDYLTLERPKTESGYVFIAEHRPYTRLKNVSMSNVAGKIMDAAGIRQADGDRRGLHIFRHRLATELLGRGVVRPVISHILGHEDPDSLEPYLSADFVHLKECALSVERFPIDEGVFENA